MDVGIIGAGPRGLLVLYQLIKHFPRSSIQHMNVDLFDYYSAGGKIWRISQYKYLIMDTVAQQITMFPQGEGPNLYQWIEYVAMPYINSIPRFSKTNKTRAFKDLSKVGPNDFAPRYLYGLYLKWYYQRLLRHKPIQVRVRMIRHNVKDVKKAARHYIAITSDGHRYTVNKIVISLGLTKSYLTAKERSLSRFAQRHGLLFSPLGYVENKPLAHVKPRETVAIEGLGLNFADCVNILSLGRGGRYRSRHGLLTYVPSGKEPRIIAGSRSGLPYYCKSYNQKPNGQHPRPYFISKQSVLKHLVNGRLRYGTFIRLLKLDMELMYYYRLLQRTASRLSANVFKTAFIMTRDHAALIKHYGLDYYHPFRLDKALAPFKDVKITGVKQYQALVKKWLLRVIHHSNQGNVKDPLSAAFEVLRDGRNEIRYIVENHLFSPADYYYRFLPRFNRLNRMLVMGPPVIDLKYYYALMTAGLLTIMPPKIAVKKGLFRFQVYSRLFPVRRYHVKAYIEARDPLPKISLSSNQLVLNLRRRGMLTLDNLEIKGYQKVIDCALVKNSTDQAIDQNHDLEPNLYVWGLATEGLHWLTQNSPHTSGHDINILTADRIARNLLRWKDESNAKETLCKK